MFVETLKKIIIHQIFSLSLFLWLNTYDKHVLYDMLGQMYVSLTVQNSMWFLFVI